MVAQRIAGMEAYHRPKMFIYLTGREKLYEQQLDIRIFADDFLRAAVIPKDSL